MPRKKKGEIKSVEQGTLESGSNQQNPNDGTPQRKAPQAFVTPMSETGEVLSENGTDFDLGFTVPFDETSMRDFTKAGEMVNGLLSHLDSTMHSQLSQVQGNISQVDKLLSDFTEASLKSVDQALLQLSQPIESLIQGNFEQVAGTIQQFPTINPPEQLSTPTAVALVPVQPYLSQTADQIVRQANLVAPPDGFGAVDPINQQAVAHILQQASDWYTQYLWGCLCQQHYNPDRCSKCFTQSGYQAYLAASPFPKNLDPRIVPLLQATLDQLAVKLYSDCVNQRIGPCSSKPVVGPLPPISGQPASKEPCKCPKPECKVCCKKVPKGQQCPDGTHEIKTPQTAAVDPISRIVPEHIQQRGLPSTTQSFSTTEPINFDSLECPEEKEKEKCPPVDESLYCVYQVHGKDECYIVFPGGEIRDKKDKKLGCYSNLYDAERKRKECEASKKKTDPPSQQKPSAVDFLQACSTNFCSALDNFLTSTGQITKSGKGSDCTNPLEGKWIVNVSLEDLVGGIHYFFCHALKESIAGLPATFGPVAEGILKLIGCEGKGVGGVLVTRLALSFLERWLGDAFSEVQRPFDYAFNAKCPTGLPTAENAIEALLSNDYSLDQAKCISEANGMCWEPWKSIADSRRSKLSPIELTQLWRRGIITEQEHDRRIRQLGFVVPSDPIEIRTLSEQIPFVSDLLRFMIRDVEDTKTIDWSASDSLFTQKWAGQLQQWGNSQGVTDTYAKYAWRAHWHIPSFTQLSEIYHRERYSGNFGTAAELRTKIVTAMQQDDIHPDWVEPLLAISFRPLTRVDTKRAYEVGTLDKQAVVKSYWDQGYDDENATILADFTEKQAQLKWFRNSNVKLYIDGVIDEPTLNQLLTYEGMRPEFFPEVIRYAGIQRAAKRNRKCIQAVRRQYLLGGYDDITLHNALNVYAPDAQGAAYLAGEFACEKRARNKLPPAATLCKWFDQGLLNVQEFVTRLMHLGYDQSEASLVVASCQRNMGLKMQKQAEQQARQQAAETKRLSNDAKKLLRERQQAANQANRLVDAKMRADERREDLKLKGAILLSDKTGVQSAITARDINRAVSTLRTVYNRTLDDAIQAVVLAVEKLDSGNIVDFFPLAVEIAKVEQIIEGDIVNGENQPSESVNGVTHPS